VVHGFIVDPRDALPQDVAFRGLNEERALSDGEFRLGVEGVDARAEDMCNISQDCLKIALRVMSFFAHLTQHESHGSGVAGAKGMRRATR
jgi:hypothetical protein